MNKLPMSEMVDRRVYRIHSRNLVVGAWRASTQGFIGVREKFGDLYLFEEHHAEVMGTAFAIEDLDVVVPDDMPLREHLPGSWCRTHDRPCHFEKDGPDSPLGKWFHDDDGSLLDERDHPYIKENKALFDLLRPFDKQINEQLMKEHEQAIQEAESKRWAPPTREEFERGQRIKAAEDWYASHSREEKLGNRDLFKEFQRRLKEACAE